MLIGGLTRISLDLAYIRQAGHRATALWKLSFKYGARRSPSEVGRPVNVFANGVKGKDPNCGLETAVSDALSARHVSHRDGNGIPSGLVVAASVGRPFR
jgi:hypothetical protein